jgi:hypothetical protein
MTLSPFWMSPKPTKPPSEMVNGWFDELVSVSLETNEKPVLVLHQFLKQMSSLQTSSKLKPIFEKQICS